MTKTETTKSKGKVWGYIRVSTKRQLEGNGLEIQKNAILDRFPTAEIIEEQFTGRVVDRPKFDALIDKLEAGDTLVVHKLDRFARTSLEGMKLMNELLEQGVTVEVLNFGSIEGGFSSRNKLMMQIFFAFAEYERDCIVERTQAGKEVAKQDPSFKDGRPKKFKKGQYKLAIELKEQGKTYKQIEQMTGLSKSTVFRAHREYKTKKILDNK